MRDSAERRRRSAEEETGTVIAAAAPLRPAGRVVHAIPRRMAHA
jgi:hypothetical protein